MRYDPRNVDFKSTVDLNRTGESTFIHQFWRKRYLIPFGLLEGFGRNLRFPKEYKELIESEGCGRRSLNKSIP